MARLRFALLVAIVLVVGHDLTYATANGLGGMAAALRDTGHDSYWAPTAVLVAVLATTVVAATLARRGRLVGELRSLQARRRSIGIAELGAAPTFFLAARLVLTALVIFTLQENIEHYTAHAGHTPGFGVLAGHAYASTLPIFVALAVLVAAIARFFAADTAKLIAAIAAARGLLRSHYRVVGRRPNWVNLPRSVGVAANPELGRAPPLLLVS